MPFIDIALSTSVISYPYGYIYITIREAVRVECARKDTLSNMFEITYDKTLVIY